MTFKKKNDEQKLPSILYAEIKPERILKQIHSFEGKLSDFITSFSGSMWFVYFHVVWFTFWILANHNLFDPTIKIFDPFPYGLLTMIVSLEAIFLSTFILISQNRQALIEKYRELEDIEGQEEEEQQQEDLEEEVEDIQTDLDDIKNAISFIQEKINRVDKTKTENGNGNDQ